MYYNPYKNIGKGGNWLVYYFKKYWLFILIGCLIVIGFFYFNGNPNLDQDLELDAMGTVTPEFVQKETDSPLETAEMEQYVVDIKGAVQNPGVYDVQVDTRIVDVITLANGFTKNADEKRVNLAQRVQDEMMIYIPKIGEEVDVIPIAASNGGANTDDMVRINQATTAELETLTGIGPGKAQAILDHIAEHGPFMEVDDLLAVSGIGEKTLEKFKDNIIVP